jgi:Xaa-Pro dipeptidase
MREAGTDYPAMPTWVASGPRNRGGHRTPTPRVVERGDTVKIEFAGVERRYHAVTMQTFAVGEPSPHARGIYDACRDALVVGSKEVVAGAPVARSEEAAVAHLRAAGLDPSDMARFGYGVGLQFPPTWLEPLDIIVESPQVFARGMSFVLHVGMKDSTLQHGALVGGAYVLGEGGLECLSGGPLPLFVA